MAATITMRLDTGRYKVPTEEDIQAAKDYILERESVSALLKGEIDEVLAEVAERIVAICYKYNVEPKAFTISSQYNEGMMREIEAVMDEAEEAILDLIYRYAERATDNSKVNKAVAAWMATLGRGNRNLQETLDNYLYKYMKDLEAAIAALRHMNVKLADAVSKVKTYMHHIYEMPEVLTAIRNRNGFAATLIQFGGIQRGAVGISNNGSTNVTRMAEITMQMAWMRAQGLQFAEEGAVGYYQLRGSGYNCDTCDEEVGFHEGTDGMLESPLLHPNCCCFRVPIFEI